MTDPVPLLGERTRRRLSFLINFLFWALWVFLLLAAGRLLTRLLMPFVTAFVLAALLQRPMAALERRYRWRHGFAATAITLLSLILIGGVLTAVGWQGGVWLTRLFQQENARLMLQQLTDRLEQAIRLVIERLTLLLPEDMAALLENVGANAKETLYSLGSDLLSRLSGAAMSFATGALPRFLLASLFFILSAFFFTRDFAGVTGFLKRQIPSPQRPLASAAVRILKETAGGVLRAYIVMGGITFAELALGFWALRLPCPLLLAAVTALVDILPVFGVGTVLFPLILFRLLTGNLLGGVLLILLYAAATAVRNLLQPKLVSRHTGLPPLITLLTMYAGWRAFGFIGILGAPVLAVVLLQLQREGFLRIFR